ncbi:MAG: exodeoxyribonuclease V subunit gamma [Bacteroidales bacterium]|nr:exodeoxyribonuclease V subunit gamma [Bacteroidales bacterium]
MLRVYLSNRIEQLSKRLAKNIASPSEWYIPDTFIMQTSGMEQWLSIELSKKNGIHSNYQVFKPNAFINQLYQIIGLKQSNVFKTEHLKWLIYKILETTEFKSKFPYISSYYLNDDIKKLQLSVQLSDLFDQYLLYRQEYLEAWNNNKKAEITVQEDLPKSTIKYRQQQLDKHQNWQAFLWRAIKASIPSGEMDKAELKNEFLKHIDDSGFQKTVKESFGRICLFGLSVITDYHIDIFYQLSKWTNVDLYFLNPAPETYWYDTVNEKFAYYLEKRTGKSAEEHKIYIGNEFLSGYANLAKDTFNILFKHDEFINAIEDVEMLIPEEETLLNSIQKQIFLDKKIASIELNEQLINDESLIIASSYTKTREVEALYHQILNFFEKDELLKPNDIIVQVSDIDAYTPIIKSIFGNAPYPIPYTIADRSYKGNDTLVGSLQKLLKLQSENLVPEQILELIETEVIANQFKLNSLETIRKLIKEANIHFDTKGKKDDETHLVSWQYGFEKIFLGYAMSAPNGLYINEEYIIPTDSIEGLEYDNVFRFKAFFDLLNQMLNERQHDRTLIEWKAYVEFILDQFFKLDDSLDIELKYIQKQLGDLDEMQQYYPKPVSYEVFVKSFNDALFSNPRAGNFINGNLIFCSMIPMRSIPFKIVAMLGLNNGVFPRKNQALAFDLLKIEHKRGDRNTKNNDKYLFLENMLSARQKLYLSYVGQSEKDNSEIPPSIIIDELLDNLQSAEKTGVDIREKLIKKHPFHNYSRKYNLKGGALVRYDIDVKTSEQNIIRETNTSQSNPISVDINELIRFFKDPIKYYYKTILKVKLDDDDEFLNDTELFDLNNLQTYQIKNLLLNSNENNDSIVLKLKTKGELPLATKGILDFKTISSSIQDLIEQKKQLTTDIEAKKTIINLTLRNLRLTGIVSDIYNKNRFEIGLSKNNSKNWISLFINHLALSASGFNLKSLLLNIDPSTNLQISENIISNEEAFKTLNRLAEFYIEGQKYPLLFSPAQGEKLVNDLQKKPENEAIETYLKSIFKSNESQNSYTDQYWMLAIKQFNRKQIKIHEKNLIALSKLIFSSK